MFEGLDTLRIKGAGFKLEKALKPLLKKPITILYGRNGSGKSTIARALREIIDTPENLEFEKASLNRPLTSEEKANTYIFDKSFIEQNVQFRENGLTTIVMLGEQGSLSEQLEQVKSEIVKKEEDLEKLMRDIQSLEDRNQITAPIHWSEKIKAELTKEGGWAQIDSQIKGNTRRSNVTDATYSEIMRSLLSESNAKDQLKSKFIEKFNIFRQSGDTNVVVPITFKEYVIPNDINELQKLLSQKMEEPILSERDKYIIELVKGKDSDLVNRAKFAFSSGGYSICPYCQREITIEEKQEICNRIEKVLNEKVERYIKLLSSELSKFNVLTIDFRSFSKVSPSLVNNIENAKKELNKEIESICEIIEKKRNSPYSPNLLTIKKEAYRNAVESYNNCVKQLKGAITLYNDAITQRAALKSELLLLNMKIAAVSIKSTWREYQKCIQIKKQKDDEYKNLSSVILELKKNKDQIEQQMEQTNIALHFINKALSYVFFSKSRIALEEGKRCYKLKSNGEDVAPDKVSIGERNIIALCYFFAQIAQRKKDEERYTSPYLLIIDDPISSFDKENRLGVMSFLRWQVSALHNGNRDTKILLMTHDLLVAAQMGNIASDINVEHEIVHLQEQQIKEWAKYKNDYKKILYDIYEFAKSNHPESESNLSNIGNTMRRWVEAYSTFEYSTTFLQFFQEEDALSMIAVEKRTFYENLMARLVLNGTSHEEYRIYSLSDINELFTPEEMQKTAKAIIMFIHYTNPLHLSVRLKKQAEDFNTTLNGWKYEKFDEL